MPIHKVSKRDIKLPASISLDRMGFGFEALWESLSSSAVRVCSLPMLFPRDATENFNENFPYLNGPLRLPQQATCAEDVVRGDKSRVNLQRLKGISEFLLDCSWRSYEVYNVYWPFTLLISLKSSRKVVRILERKKIAAYRSIFLWNTLQIIQEL